MPIALPHSVHDIFISPFPVKEKGLGLVSGVDDLRFSQKIHPSLFP